MHVLIQIETKNLFFSSSSRDLSNELILCKWIKLILIEIFEVKLPSVNKEEKPNDHEILIVCHQHFSSHLFILKKKKKKRFFCSYQKMFISSLKCLEDDWSWYFSSEDAKRDDWHLFRREKQHDQIKINWNQFDDAIQW